MAMGSVGKSWGLQRGMQSSARGQSGRMLRHRGASHYHAGPLCAAGRGYMPICNVASTSSPPTEEAQAARCDEGGGSKRVTFRRAAKGTQIGATAATALLGCFCVCADDLPALRLGLLTYGLWASGEWVVHRYLMHAPAGSFGDRFWSLNKLHVKHHAETNKDMTMAEGFDEDALYFHFPNSLLQVGFACAVGLVADAGLDLAIPATWIPVAAVAGMLVHNLLWNTMHMDMHEVPSRIDDGVPCVPYERKAAWRPYVQWCFDNHTTHHDVGGRSNYNIVFPGPDWVLGTYMHRSDSVEL